jgi:hypothetical protein
LAEKFGVTVLFMTANPSQLGEGIPGTLGVIPKPVMDDDLRQAVAYAISRHRRMPGDPPARLHLFAANLNQASEPAGLTG